MKHRAGLAFVLVGIVACLTLGVPQSTVACTGCAEPLSDVVGPADRVLLGTITSASETGGYTFAVERVLKGNAPSVVDFPPGSIRTFTVGSRWILVLYPGHALETVNAFRVEPDGTVVSPGPFDAPTTLTAFIAWFAAPATDTLSSSPLPPTWPLVFVLAFVCLLARFTARTRLD
jgi:hypothetical protein